MTVVELATRTGFAVAATFVIRFAIATAFVARKAWAQSPLGLRVERWGQSARERLGLRPASDLYVGGARLEEPGLPLWAKAVIGLGGAALLFLLLMLFQPDLPSRR